MDDKILEQWCDVCDSNKAEYKYQGDVYCHNCMFDELDIEEVTHTHLYVNGMPLGDSGNMSEVISNLGLITGMKELNKE